MIPTRSAIASCFMLLAIASTASAQGRPDPAKLIAAQQKAMEELPAIDGVWRGPAWILLPSGEKHSLIQTERVGPMLNGSVKVMEGRGYEADGSVGFNAFGTISYDPGTGAYALHAYAQGNVGDFPLTITSDGYAWEIPAGPMTIRYTAVLTDTTWQEVGERVAPGGETVRFFEMTLTRVGDSSWPAAGAIARE